MTVLAGESARLSVRWRPSREGAGLALFCWAEPSLWRRIDGDLPGSGLSGRQALGFRAGTSGQRRQIGVAFTNTREASGKGGVRARSGAWGCIICRSSNWRRAEGRGQREGRFYWRARRLGLGFFQREILVRMRHTHRLDRLEEGRQTRLEETPQAGGSWPRGE